MKTNMKKLLLAASLAALTSACAGAWNGAEEAMTVAEEHPISVDTQVVTLTIDVRPDASELSSMDKARIKAFADAYLSAGHGSIAVTTPAGGDTDRAGRELASITRSYLNEVGVDWAAISGSAYGASENGPRQVILSYTRYVATPSACGIWKGVKARDYANRRSPNFGCATQNNLAAMIADPRDLVEPADRGEADATSRIRVINAYRKGEITSSQTDDIDAQVAN